MLQTERLRLRAWRHGDVAALRRMTRNEAVVRHVGGGRLWDDDKLAEFVRRQRRQQRRLGYCLWAVQPRQGPSAIIGYVGLQPLGDTGEVEIGWLLDQPWWGRGLATEAARGALEHGFEKIGLDRVVAIAEPTNVASIGVMRKLGMVFERRMSWKGFDVVLYARSAR